LVVAQAETTYNDFLPLFNIEIRLHLHIDVLELVAARAARRLWNSKLGIQAVDAQGVSIAL
jgi:hypothetical protein